MSPSPAPRSASDLEQQVLRGIRDVPDFPKPGIVFKDIAPLLADPELFAAAVDGLAADVEAAAGVGTIAGIEARGFILSAALAYRCHAGLVPVRKAGKLPGRRLSASYDLEYGAATLEVHTDAFAPGERVLVVDDVLATGGTAVAAVDLVRRAGGRVVGVSVLLELRGLGGRDAIVAAYGSEFPVRALATVDA